MTKKKMQEHNQIALKRTLMAQEIILGSIGFLENNQICQQTANQLKEALSNITRAELNLIETLKELL